MMATILPSELCIGPAGDWAGSWHRHEATGALFTNAAAAAEAANSLVSLCRVTRRVLVRQYMRGPGKDVFLGVRMVVCVCVSPYVCTHGPLILLPCCVIVTHNGRMTLLVMLHTTPCFYS